MPALTTHRDVFDRLLVGDYVVFDTESVADRNVLDLTEMCLCCIRQHVIDVTSDISTQRCAGHVVCCSSVKMSGITDDLLEKYGQPRCLVKTLR